MKKFITIAILLLTFSCASKKKTVTEVKEKVETLTFTETIKLDTTLFIPGAKASLFIPFSELVQKGKDTETSSAQGKREQRKETRQHKVGNATVTVTKDSLGITATANCDDVEAELQFYIKRVAQLEKREKDTKITETKKRGYTFFDVLLYILTTAVIAFVAGYLTKTLNIIKL